MDENTARMVDKVIAKEAFRRNVFELIPHGSARILDFGCDTGSLALRLMRDKGCTEVYGLDVNRAATKKLEGVLTRVWNVNMERDNEDLPDEFENFFNTIILHDVVEHFYDPWYCLAKLRRFLAPDGRLLLATPNLQYWDFLHKILSGEFPYGPGLWHTGHLRWYTVKSLIELVTITGYSIESIKLEIPARVDAAAFNPPKLRTSLQLPPEELAGEHPGVPPITIGFAKDIGPSYPVFFAHKLIFVCNRRSDMIVKPSHMVYNCSSLANLRAMIDNPFDVYTPPPMDLLIGDWN